MGKQTWQVTENNGGGLTLYVWHGGELVFAHAGYEYTTDNLREDLENLKNGGDPIVDGWEGNDLTNEEIIRGIRRHYDNETGREELAGEDEINDADGNIIPLTQEEYYDEHESTKVICDQDGPVAEDEMGAAGSSVFYPEAK